MYIRNEGPLKGYYTKAYKPRDPSPISYREGIKNIKATIIISGELVLRKKNTIKAVKDRRPLIQIKINYMHYKISK